MMAWIARASGGGLMQRLRQIGERRQDGPIFRDQRHPQLLGGYTRMLVSTTIKAGLPA